MVMLCADDQHLDCFLLIEIFVNLAHAGDKVFMHKRLVLFLFEESHLRTDFFESNQLARKCANSNTWFSQLVKLLCHINELLLVSNSVQLSPELPFLFWKRNFWQVEPHVRIKVFKVVNLMFNRHGHERCHWNCQCFTDLLGLAFD